jgi:hypothetical protein
LNETSGGTYKFISQYVMQSFLWKCPLLLLVIILLGCVSSYKASQTTYATQGSSERIAQAIQRCDRELALKLVEPVLEDEAGDAYRSDPMERGKRYP